MRKSVSLFLLVTSAVLIALLLPKLIAAALLNVGNTVFSASLLPGTKTGFLTGRLEDSLDLFYTTALEFDSGNPRTYAAIGARQERDGNHEAASGAFEQATSLAPQDSVSWYRLGNTYQAANNLEAARQAWKKSGYMPYLIQREMDAGFISGKTQDWTATEAAFKRALQIDPTYARGYYHLAGLYWGRGRWMDVEWAIQKQLEFEQSESFESRFSRGRLFLLRANWEAAANEFEKALVFMNEDGWALNFLGISRYRLGDTDGARVALEQAATLLPQDFRSRALLSWIYRQKKDEARAEDYYQKAVAVAGNIQVVNEYMNQFR